MKVLEEGKTCSCCKEYQHKLDFNKNKILDGDQKGWWNEGSVEDWYQKNKLLLVDSSSIELNLKYISPSNVFFSENDKD